MRNFFPILTLLLLVLSCGEQPDQYVQSSGTAQSTNYSVKINMKGVEMPVEQVRDSIPYEVVVEKPVRVRSGYDKFCSIAFWIMVVIVLGRIAWWAFKKFYLH